MSEDTNEQKTPGEDRLYVLQEMGTTVKLHHEPTPELRAINEKVPGVFRERGTVCAYFPQNLVANFLVRQYWDTFIATSGYPPEQVREVLPSAYLHAVTMLPEVDALVYHKDSKNYFPLTDARGAQIRFRNVLFRQAYSIPTGMVLEPPYAGLLLSLPGTVRETGLSGYRPEQIKGMVVERLLNDDTLDNPRRPAYHVQASSAHADPDKHDFDMVDDIMERMIKLDDQIRRDYGAFVADLKAQGKPLNALPYIIDFCRKYDIPYDPDQVNYRLL